MYNILKNNSFQGRYAPKHLTNREKKLIKNSDNKMNYGLPN